MIRFASGIFLKTMTEELRQEIQTLVDKAVRLRIEQLERSGKILKPDSVWITQNKAHKMAGRRKVEKAMELGQVRFQKKDLNSRTSMVMVNRKDIEKLVKQPFIS